MTNFFVKKRGSDFCDLTKERSWRTCSGIRGLAKKMFGACAYWSQGQGLVAGSRAGKRG